MKNIHRYVIRYAISLYLHQSDFKNKSKCDIAVTCHLFCKKKRTSWSFDCCISNSFGYKALKILEVTSILNIQKDYCSGFIKNIRYINYT